MWFFVCINVRPWLCVSASLCVCLSVFVLGEREKGRESKNKVGSIQNSRREKVKFSGRLSSDFFVGFSWLQIALAGLGWKILVPKTFCRRGTFRDQESYLYYGIGIKIWQKLSLHQLGIPIIFIADVKYLNDYFYYVSIYFSLSRVFKSRIEKMSKEICHKIKNHKKIFSFIQILKM